MMIARGQSDGYRRMSTELGGEESSTTYTKLKSSSNGTARSLDTSLRQCVLGSKNEFHAFLNSTLRTTDSAQGSKQYSFGYAQGLNHGGLRLLGSTLWKYDVERL